MKNKVKFLVLILVLVLLGSAVFGVIYRSKYTNTQRTKITANFKYPISNLDPIYNKFTDECIISFNLFEGLMTYNIDGDLVLGLAEKYEVSEDGTTYTFTLKENALWSNGEKITAEDFKYSWIRALKESYYIGNIIKNSERFINGEISEDEVGIEVLDSKTLKVTLEHPNTSFLQLLATVEYMPVYKQSVLDKNDWVRNPELFISSGPFKLKKIETDKQILLEKNNSYWDRKNVKLEEIVINFLSDSDIAYQSLKDGKYDYINYLDISKLEDAIENNLVQSKESPTVNLIEINTNGKNVSKEVKEFLSNKKVRQAMILSIDREYIAKGIGEPSYSYIPPSLIKTLDSEVESKKYYGTYLENKDKALKLLEEAGYGKNGKAIPQIELKYYGENKDKHIFNTVKENFNAIGIDVKLNKVESELAFDMRDGGRFELMQFNWTPDFYDIYGLLNVLLSDSDMNSLNYNNKEFDNLINEANIENDPKEKVNKFQQAESIIMEESIVIPIMFPDLHKGVSKELKDIIFLSLGEVYFKNAYIEE